MRELVYLAGSVAGALTDPLNLTMFAIAAMVGWYQGHWSAPAALALAATVLNVALAWSWWRELGLAWQGRAPFMLLVKLVLCYAGFGIGHAARAGWRRAAG